MNIESTIAVEAMRNEPRGPHNDFCPMRHPAHWRARYDRYATCDCSNRMLGRMLRKPVGA